MPLYIPKGYRLVVLGCRGQSRAPEESYEPPVLLDLQQREYPMVGCSLRFTQGDASLVEFAYSAVDKSGKAYRDGVIPQQFPDRVEALAANKAIRNVRFYYLVPCDGRAVGIVGFRLTPGGSSKSLFFGMPPETDALLVPAW